MPRRLDYERPSEPSLRDVRRVAVLSLVSLLSSAGWFFCFWWTNFARHYFDWRVFAFGLPVIADICACFALATGLRRHALPWFASIAVAFAVLVSLGLLALLFP